MLNETEMGHNVVEATKNIRCVKDEDAVDASRNFVRGLHEPWQSDNVK